MSLHAHLMEHLRRPPAEIVDVGGGAGHQSIPLARAGYRVTIVDPSPVMLGRGRPDARGGAAPGRGARRWSRPTVARGARAPRGDRFDGVLCHGVLMYLDDPIPLVTALCELVGPDGIVSVVTKNRRTLAMRPGLEGDWAGASAAFDADAQVNGLDIETRADDVDELSELLRRPRGRADRLVRRPLLHRGLGPGPPGDRSGRRSARGRARGEPT